MEIIINLSKEEIDVLVEHQFYRVNAVLAGVSKREPFDDAIQKIINAIQKAKETETRDSND